jgi:hypothetical protein
MKRALASTFVFTLLASLLVGTQVLDMVYGNFAPPPSPDRTPPRISVISPANKTYENKVLLHLKIEVAYHQWINHVSYTLDSQNQIVYSGGIRDLNWSTILDGLSEGPHSLKVSASCKSYYMTSSSGGNPYYRIYGTSSDVVNFTIVYTPEISILSLENKTYKTNNIPLDFAVNEPASKIEYCLDGQEKLIIDGNLTLTGLSDGLHNVTIYATDVDGYVGVSETAYFEIETFPTTLVVASASLVTIAVFAVFLLMRKHKH